MILGLLPVRQIAATGSIARVMGGQARVLQVKLAGAVGQSPAPVACTVMVTGVLETKPVAV